ncbi:hypothetical protein FF124_03145 [Martelella lutilitoris]|uniref:Uncharacterized protein n=1 Tax=Martelella lutilitoris TaxID=2583532 RepID=A0A5C4JUN3_9HYPH|nr:hypothetical protein FF124_03145 [Martelella lutilitoris]
MPMTIPAEGMHLLGLSQDIAIPGVNLNAHMTEKQVQAGGGGSVSASGITPNSAARKRTVRHVSQ